MYMYFAYNTTTDIFRLENNIVYILTESIQLVNHWCVLFARISSTFQSSALVRLSPPIDESWNYSSNMTFTECDMDF
jgi:hypothetical protein